MKLTGNQSQQLEGELLAFLAAINADLEEPKFPIQPSIPPIDELLAGVDLIDIAPTVLQPQIDVAALEQNYLLQPTMPLKIKLSGMENVDESTTTQACKVVRNFHPVYPKVNFSAFNEQSPSTSKKSSRVTLISYLLWLTVAFSLGLLVWIFLLR